MNDNENTSSSTTNVTKYPSAEFLYSVSLEDYNRVLLNYDRIYDRINITLALCGVVLVAILDNVDFSVLCKWIKFSPLEKTAIAIYMICAIASVVLIVSAIIKLLLLSKSKEILSFDSNAIKTEELYDEKTEDVALWITLQYIRVINNIREKILEKQKDYNTATTRVIISLFTYVVSMIIYKGGLL